MFDDLFEIGEEEPQLQLIRRRRNIRLHQEFQKVLDSPNKRSDKNNKLNLKILEFPYSPNLDSNLSSNIASSLKIPLQLHLLSK